MDSLLDSYLRLASTGEKVAAIGPLIINKDTGQPYKHRADLRERYSETGFVISSGSIVAMDTFAAIGLMMEGLFIDYVDSEWCWRARNRGYKSFIDTTLHMPHKVGENERKVLGFPVLCAKPFRYYYVYRNILLLYRKDMYLGFGKRKVLSGTSFACFTSLSLPVGTVGKSSALC